MPAGKTGLAMNSDTICALASAAGRAGIAVIRISGPNTSGVIGRFTGIEAPVPREARLSELRDPADGALLDRGIVLWFPAPRSFTGEDVAELHIHGGRASVGAVLGALANEPGLRLAEPGEFTRRSFENGKLDLTEAEGLADLVDAETEAQRRQALNQLGGELGRLYEGWREALVASLAHLEAGIDFADEDLPEGVLEGARVSVSTLLQDMRAHLADNRRGERLRDGVEIAILGAPNVGKSSLLNALARRDVAIVSSRAGTTRDVIEVHLDLGGYPVTLADTAGLREVDDEIEEEGVRRSRARAEAADLKIIMFDVCSQTDPEPESLALLDDEALPVLNKIDLRPSEPVEFWDGFVPVPISVATGEGISELLASLEARVAGLLEISPAPALTRTRHRTALIECAEALARSLEADAPELTVEDLRLAARALGRITGRVDVEDILDVIFSDFCIGK